MPRVTFIYARKSCGSGRKKREKKIEKTKKRKEEKQKSLFRYYCTGLKAETVTRIAETSKDAQTLMVQEVEG